MNKKVIILGIFLGIIILAGGILYNNVGAQKKNSGPSVSIDYPFTVRVYGGGEHDEGSTFDFRVEVSRDSETFAVKTKEQPQHPWDFHRVSLTDDSWSVEDIDIETEAEGEVLTPKTATIPGGTGGKNTRFIGKTPLTCATKGRDTIKLPKGVRIEFTFESKEEIPQLADKKIAGEGNKYKVQVKRDFAFVNTLLFVECTEVKGGFSLLHQCFACDNVPKGGICMPSMVGSKEECDDLGGEFLETKLEE